MRPLIPILVIAITGSLPSVRAQFPATHELPGDLSFAPAAGEQRHAALARGNGQSLIVYEDHRAALGDTVAYTSTGVAVLSAARFDASGALIDSIPISVRKGTNSPRDPRVAWNGSTYLVVWDELVRHTSQSDRGVFAARIDTAGNVLDDPPMLLADTSYVDESFPVVASDGTNWAVVWEGIVGGSDAIEGCVIDASGVPGPVRTMMTSTVGLYFPVGFEMAWSNGRYLFVSYHYSSGVSFNQVHGQLFDAALIKVGTEFRLSTGPGAAADPWVAGNGTDFCVAWRQANSAIRATPVTAAGVVVVPDGVDVMGPTPGYAAYQLPVAVWDGVDWAITFATTSGQTSGMNVSKLSTNGVLASGSPVSISQGAWKMERPACAPVAGGVQIVWDDTRIHPNPSAGFASDRTDVFSTVVTFGGAPSAPVDVTQSPPAQLDPQIAGDATQGYLVAFFSVTQSTVTVNAQRLDPAGHPVDQAPIALFSGQRTLHNLAVAWSGSNWMLVWDELTPTGSNIQGMRIATDGSVLDASPIAIMPGSGPSIAAVNGEYMIVASHSPAQHQSYVYTMRVRASDGALMDAAPVQRTNVGYDTQTNVAAFSDRWIVSWVHAVTHDAPYASIRYMIVHPVGSSTAADVAGSGPYTNNEPVIATDGQQALLVWTSGGDVLGRRILLDGTKLDTDSGFVISSANGQQFAPSVAWNGNEYEVAFGDYRAHVNALETGIGDVYAARVDSSGVVLDPSGAVVANEAMTPEGRPSAAGGGSRTVVALDALRTHAPFGNWRVAVTARLPQAGTSFCFGDGTGTACPCGNTGATGRGCASSTVAGGAVLSATGVAGSSVSTDTLVLTATDIPGPGLFFQADGLAATPISFGDGHLCAAVGIIRLGVVFPTAGVASYPGGLTPNPIHIAGGTTRGDVRHYQCWYRDALVFCTSSTFNLTQGLTLTWGL